MAATTVAARGAPVINPISRRCCRPAGGTAAAAADHRAPPTRRRPAADDDVQPVGDGALPRHHVAAGERRIDQVIGKLLPLATVERGKQLDTGDRLQPPRQIALSYRLAMRLAFLDQMHDLVGQRDPPAMRWTIANRCRRTAESVGSSSCGSISQ